LYQKDLLQNGPATKRATTKWAVPKRVLPCEILGSCVGGHANSA